MTLLSLRSVSKTYMARSGSAARRALDSVSLDLESSDFVAVMGPSGSGKTTMLNLIGLIDRPDSGSILYEGFDTSRLAGSELSDFRRRSIGIVFQDANLIDTMSLEENIALPLAFDRAEGERIDERIASLSAALGIGDILGKYPAEVSGGQRQRAASARALACGPRLLLADEPTGALDSRSGRELMECFSSFNETLGSAVLMVTHDPFAASWARRVLFLRDGQIFTEIRRAGERRDFFDRIMEVQAAMEGQSR
jgi:ABC-type antimicrobial peptide transport system, ATPase component